MTPYLDELGRLTGEDTTTLQLFVEAGLLVRRGQPITDDVERIRLLQSLRRRGIDPLAVRDALARELGPLERNLAQLRPQRGGSWFTMDEAAARIGVDVSLLERMWEAGGLGTRDELLSDDDVDAMAALRIGLRAGFPEEALLQLVRVYADALSRAAEAGVRLFHFYVHKRLASEGLEGDALEAATGRSIAQVSELAEPVVAYFHRRGMVRAVRDDLALHLAEAAGLVPADDATGRLHAAVLFIDLARFTALNDAMGDVAAADVLHRFSELVRRRVVPQGGRVVKQIGDEFMLVFDDPRSALACAMDIRDTALVEPQFLGTRQGLHWGPVLYREGDYFGATVNLAARIVAEAAADRVLVSEAVRVHAADLETVAFVAAGRRRVKGVVEPVDLFEARRPREDAPADRATDPVCGMTVAPSSPPARLEMDGMDLVFCSHECLHRFVAHPELYLAR